MPEGASPEQQRQIQDKLDPVALVPRANLFLARANVHPLIKALWRPRLVAGLDWVVQQTLDYAEAGRRMIDAERSGEMTIDGVKISGKADGNTSRVTFVQVESFSTRPTFTRSLSMLATPRAVLISVGHSEHSSTQIADTTKDFDSIGLSLV